MNIYLYQEDAEIEYGKIVEEFCLIVPVKQENVIKKITGIDKPEVEKYLLGEIDSFYKSKEKEFGRELWIAVIQSIYLSTIDKFWTEHLTAIDDLREGIGLRGYGQRDPLVEYKNEAFNMFERLISSIDSEIVHRIFKVQVQLAPQAPRSQVPTPAPMPVAPQGLQPSIVRRIQTNAPQQSVAQPVVNSSNKLGRNDPCWCGSGKKWKKCHYPQAG